MSITGNDNHRHWIGWILVSLVLGFVVPTAAVSEEKKREYDDMFQTAYAYYGQDNRKRVEAIAKFEKLLSRYPTGQDNVEAEYYIAQLWRGDRLGKEKGDPEKYLERLKHILKKYESLKVDYWYFYVKVTYAQLMWDTETEKSRESLWQAIRIPPDSIRIPKARGPGLSGPETIRFLKRGAVWALLHQETGQIWKKKSTINQKKKLAIAIAKEIQADLKSDPATRSWAKDADSWMEVAKTVGQKPVKQPEKKPVLPKPSQGLPNLAFTRVSADKILQDKSRFRDLSSRQNNEDTQTRVVNNSGKHDGQLTFVDHGPVATIQKIPTPSMKWLWIIASVLFATGGSVCIIIAYRMRRSKNA